MGEGTFDMKENQPEEETSMDIRRVGMENSVLKFANINFTVGGKGDNKKYLLTDVNATVKAGRVLAVMGPSGAGKTTLISALTLRALYGTSTGTVTLNGETMTDTMFRQHAYVVPQHDNHWPYLTCRETLNAAAQLYQTPASQVDFVLRKMGLETCSEVRNSSLSGGQRRRLSIGLALLKQPTVLFLDEPTSGLDAAAATAIMQEIVRVAKEEGLIIICTIHQPSTKVYNGFDQLMILSRGRPAFVGNVQDAVPYFEESGYPCPPAMNPAEFFLDLVNSDFSNEKDVTDILDSWAELGGQSTQHRTSLSEDKADEEEDSKGIVKIRRAPLATELSVVFVRHARLVMRDPILYLGRCVIFLFMNLVFAFVYWNGRENAQDQVLNKFWVNLWFIGVPTNMGVVAVYSLNEEFKSILRESKNGMISPYSYVLAKTILVIPIFFIFGLFALGLPLFVVQNAPGESFLIEVLLYAMAIYVFESVAECLSVWTTDPILGMLSFMQFWFGSFLFGGFLIPLRDLYYPFEVFYHIFPFSYYIRSVMYEIFRNVEFEPCAEEDIAVCVDSSDGLEVLDRLGKVMPLLSSDRQTGIDLLCLLAIGTVYKIMYVAGIVYKTQQASHFERSDA